MMARRYKTAILLGLTLGFVAPAQAWRPPPELQIQMRELAEQILKNTQNQPVRIGAFTATGLPHSNAGPGIEETLRAALESLHKGSVQQEARYEVKADYMMATGQADPDSKEIKLVVHIFDTAEGKELLQIDKTRLRATDTVAAITGVTGALPTSASLVDMQKAVQKLQTDRPSVFIHGDRNELISSNDKSAYAVEILVKPAGSRDQPAPREARNVDGRAFVDINQDEEYQVKIKNNSGKRVAVSMLIDGLDVFQFAKEKKQSGEPFKYYITEKKEIMISGWFVTRRMSRAFLVTAYGQGAVSQAGVASRGSVGTIHVQFSECEDEGEVITLGASAGSGERRGGNETGLGREVATNTKEVNYNIREPREFVTIRYTR
jgi:hypothetical protein